MADINIGVVTQAETAREASTQANAEKMTELPKTLKDRGSRRRTFKRRTSTSALVKPAAAAGPRPAPREFTQKIVGYDVTNTVTVTRDLSRLGELLDAVVTAGANQMNGINFRIDTPESLLDEARKKAMADAKHKADLMAGEAGVVVGSPISITDSGASPIPSPRPMMMGRMMAMASAPVPVSAGEQELSVSVHVVYELKMPK